MEKGKKSKNKILSYLPKSATISFQNLPFSPGREKTSNGGVGGGKGFSGTIIPMIPAEARMKSKSGRCRFGDQEPTSPKISCMGQIKHKHKHNKDTKNQNNNISTIQDKPKRSISNIFCGVGGGNRVPARGCEESLPDRAPALTQMRRFASSRGALKDFQWDADSDGEDHVIIPHSAPMFPTAKVTGALEPRKEVNLWKRRTMDPPKPLQLNMNSFR